MPVTRPTDLEEALHTLADEPTTHVLAGGTDLMVEVTFGHRRPERILALRRIQELQHHGVEEERLRLGAMVTYTRMEHDLAELAPGLAMAARTVGSPQIRNAGTVGGNLGTASPAGDALPWLLAMDAEVELASVRGRRTLPLASFITGPKRTALQADELITAVTVPRVRGPQHTAKIGPRNAMVISVAGVAVVLDVAGRSVRVGMGAVGPTPLRAPDAERAVADAIDWETMDCPDDAIRDFGQACADVAEPITDHRSTAEYRRHAIAVLASRSLRRCLHP